MATVVVFWLWFGVASSTSAGGPPLLEALGLRGGSDDGVVQHSFEIPPSTARAWAGMLVGVGLCGLLGPAARRLATQRDAPAAATRLRRLTIVAPFGLIAATAVLDGAYSGGVAAVLGGWWLVRVLRPSEPTSATAPGPAAAPA